MFKGWSLSPHGPVVYTDEQPVMNLAGKKRDGEKVRLYAVWKEQQTFTGYFKSQLTEPEQLIYDELTAQLDKLTDPHDPSTVVVTAEEAQSSSLEKILFAVHRDHPEYFWFDVSKLSWSEAGERRYALATKVPGESYFFDGFTAENLADYKSRFQQRVSEVVDAAPQDPLLAVKYFNAWLADHNVYNPLGLGASNFSRNAASGLLSDNVADKGPVCYGYATALKVLLDSAGIENAYIEGFAMNGSNGPSGEQHAWNYVNIDHKWYAVDPTWNDPSQSSAPALETYLLVGSDTIVAPRLSGKESFGANHDASKSPALRYGFTYPVVSTEGIAQLSRQVSEIVRNAERVQGFPSDDSLHDGDMVRLWSNFTLESPLTISRHITIDLNGFDVTSSKGSAFHVTSSGSLTLVNSSDHLVTISAQEVNPIITNEGECKVSSGIRLKAASDLLSNPQPLKTNGHAYAVQTPSSYTIYEVVEPDSLVPVTLERSDVGVTRGDLLGYVNAKGAPAIPWKFILLPGKNRLDVPAGSIPRYSWDFENAASHSAGITDALALGSYNFTASAFGYRLSYGVTVIDTQWTKLRDKYKALLQDLHDDFMKKGEDDRYFTSDFEKGRKLYQAAVHKLESLRTEEEMKSLVSDLRTQLGAIQAVSTYVNAAVDEWNKTYRQILDDLGTQGVKADSLEAAKSYVREALLPANLSAIVSKLYPSFGAAQLDELTQEVRIQLNKTGVKNSIDQLSKALAWAEPVVSALSQDKPYTAETKEGLQEYKKAYGNLSSEVKAYIASDLYRSLEAALKEEGSNPPSPNPNPEPTPPAPDPGFGSELPGVNTQVPGSTKPVGTDANFSAAGRVSGESLAADTSVSKNKEALSLSQRYAIPRLGQGQSWWILASMGAMTALLIGCAVQKLGRISNGRSTGGKHFKA